MNPSTLSPRPENFYRLGKRFLAASMVFMLAVPACSTDPFMTTDPYTREQEVNKTTKGAGIGALAGLATAIIVGGDRKKLLAGAGIGGW